MFLLSSIYAVAQPRDLTNQLLKIKSSADSLIKNYPAEKLYLQFDKPNYAVGDTLWFKAYLFNAPTLALSAKSGIMYLDIANDSNKVVKQMWFRVNGGLSWGNISLNDFPPGGYILRAYTTWMRNFGDYCFYYKHFVIAGEQPFRTRTPGNILMPNRQEIKAESELKVNLTDDRDSITVSVTGNQIHPGTSYFLMGKARNVICYGAVVNFNSNSIVRKNVPKSLFPSGITHFILTDTKGQSLNEQLIFIDHHDNLRIELQTDKQVYALRDSIAVHINITDAKGNPVKGNFSMAVTDDSQVCIDSLQDNIISRILFTSEVKGTLNQPAYYLRGHNKAGNKTVDSLLLTHGQVNYDWPSGKIRYPAEREFVVSGMVLNGFNSTVKSTKVILFSKSPFILRDTVTNKDGYFVFRNFPQIDTPIFFLKATNHHDKSFNVGIKMDELKPPAWPSSAFQSSTDTIIDTALAVAAKNNRIRKEQAYLAPNGHLLREVKIVAKR